MNKAQINFFVESASIIKNRVNRRHVEIMLPEIPSLSFSEMAGMINSGIARFKIERFSGNSCPNLYGLKNALEGLFEYPNDDLRKGLIAERQKVLADVRDRIDNYKETLCQDFVLKMISDYKQALKDFEEMSFFTAKEIKQMKKAYGELGFGHLLENIN
jgi:hypothetical protein